MNKHSAIITIVRNDHIMLPIWLSYYRNHFNSSDIYIIHNKDVDMDIPKDVNVSFLTQVEQETAGLTNAVQEKMCELLETYEYVVFSDCDEIILPVKCLSIKTYIDQLKSNNIQTVATTGYNLIHNYEVEAKIDLTVKILDQRRYIHRDNRYDKPLITCQPIIYGTGFHKAIPDSYKRDDDLWLLHLKSFDYNLTLQRQKDIYSNRKLGETEYFFNLNIQNRNVSEEFIKRELFDKFLDKAFRLPDNFPSLV